MNPFRTLIYYNNFKSSGIPYFPFAKSLFT